MKVLLLVIAFAAVSPVWNTDGADFNVSLELQGGHCSDQLTLICRHSDVPTDPNWIYNGTAESGKLLDTDFSGAMYTFQNDTEHRVTISGVGNVTALDGYIIQCVYSILGNLFKSNAVKYSFIPPEYRPALSLVNATADFFERFCTFNYSYQESCSLYQRCTPYFSVEYTVSPLLAVSNFSSGCSVEYTIRNLMRCVSYQSTATALLSNLRGIPVVVGDTVMLSPGPFTITSVSIGVGRNFINVTYMENEPDCPGYPTERYTVDVDEVQVADLTADAVQSLAINHANGSVTLFLPLLNQLLPKNAVTLTMTKYNTVPTNRSDVKGNIVTEMVTWGTSAVFELSQESSAATNDKGEASVGGVVVAIISVTTVVVVITITVALVIARKWKAKKCGTCDLKATAEQKSGAGDHTSSSVVDQETDHSANDPPNEAQPHGQHGCGSTPAAASQGPRPVKDTNKHPVPMTDKVDNDTVSEEEAPLTVDNMSKEGSNTLTKEATANGLLQATTYVGGDGYKRIGRQPKWALTRGNTAGRVEPQETEKTICAFENDPSTYYISGDTDISMAYVDGDGYKRIGRQQPKWALTRGNTAGRVEPQETVKTICAFENDPNTYYISGDTDISMQGQRTTQDLTYVTVDHSQPRPINAPNENLDVQYTGVKFDTEAPAV